MNSYILIMRQIKKGIFIKNIVIIAVILTVVFLSQQQHLKIPNNNYLLQPTQKIQEYLAGVENWSKTSIWPNVSREADQAQLTAGNEIAKQKNNIVQNGWETFKDYFAQKFSKTFGTNLK